MSPDIIPFISPPLETDMTPVRPIKANKKYSGGPNFKANCAKSGETNNKTTTEKVPPMKLAITETFRAKPPFPCFVSG